MRITSIAAENFLGVRAASVALPTPVTLFAGQNTAGKSSLQEAVRMALTGEPVRVQLKKEYGSLVHGGAKTGYAQVVMHDGRAESSATIVLPSGKASAENYVAPDALPYVLDAQRFARLDEKERRAFLFGLMGLKTDLASVKARLLARKLDAAKVERILPLLRAGFDAASKDAKLKATEAKGTWRGLTGETYGAVKAGEWRAQKPEVDTAALRAVDEAFQQAETAFAQANQELGAKQAEKQRADQHQLQLSTLRGKVASKQRVLDKLKVDEADLAQWKAKVEALQTAATPRNVLQCPCCNAHLVLNGAALEPVTVVRPPAEADKLPDFIASRDLLQRSVGNDRRDLAEIERAEASMKDSLEVIEKAPTPSEIEAIQAKVAALREACAVHLQRRDELQAAQRAADAAEELTGKAAAAHADVAAWDAIGDALAPDGIPGEILAEALDPINERLSQSALDAEWPKVELDRDMRILADGRPYALLSESEKWRVDAMLAEAVSFQSGVRLLVLDRFDVLDAKGRTDLLAWLHVLAENKEVDTALVFGTLKALPADLPPTVAGQWITNGQVGQLKEAA